MGIFLKIIVVVNLDFIVNNLLWFLITINTSCGVKIYFELPLIEKKNLKKKQFIKHYLN